MLHVGQVESGARRVDGVDVGKFVAEMALLRQEVATLHAALVATPTTPARVGRVAPADPSHVADRPTPGLYACFFGTFRLYRENTPLPLGNNRRTIEVCRYLVDRKGELVPQDVLVELLWPDAEAAQGLHRLHVAISGLRRLVDSTTSSAESFVEHADDSYRIPPHLVVSDCELFDDYFREGKRRVAVHDTAGASAAFEAALDLYTRDFLSEQIYTEWVAQRRQHFVERRLSALTFLCDRAMLTRDAPAAVEYARQILDIDNLRERAHRDLMRAHYYLGQRACAVRQYRACVAILNAELSVHPSQMTEELYAAIYADRELPVEPPLYL